MADPVNPKPELTAEQQRLRAAIEVIRTAQTLVSADVLDAVKAGMQKHREDDPYQSGYRNALGDLLLEISKKLVDRTRGPFQMIPVESSNIASMGHDSSTSSMLVEFRDGSCYRYPGVSTEDFARALKAPSKGRAVFAMRGGGVRVR